MHITPHIYRYPPSPLTFSLSRMLRITFFDALIVDYEVILLLFTAVLHLIPQYTHLLIC